MKKYIFLFSCSIVLIIATLQIPAISNEIATECSSVSVICGTATESVSCKGIIEENNGEFSAKVQISEEDIFKVKIGQSVNITCKAVGDLPLKGKVKELSNVAYQMTYAAATFTVVDAVIEIEENNADLKNGYTLTAEIIYSEVKDASILPFEGVAQDKEGKYYVYRIEDNWAVKEYVDVAFEDDKGAVLSEDCEFNKVCETPENLSGDFVRIKNVGND